MALRASWDHGRARVWLPRPGANFKTEQPPDTIPRINTTPPARWWPYPAIEATTDPEHWQDHTDPILAIVTTPIDHMCVDEIGTAMPLVVWLWSSLANTAQRAEDMWPVVHGAPLTADSIAAAWERGSGRSSLTSICAELEHHYRLPICLVG